MRTLIFGAMLVTAVLVPATQASAQCCGGAAATAVDHAAHAAPATPALPKAGCCAHHEMARPTEPAMAAAMACCNHTAAAVPADDPAVALAGLGLLNPPVKYIDVLFRDPVQVGETLLLGHYVIEHDDDRMARGEPCTYIYAADDRRAPVATFHCEHLEREEAEQATIVLAPTTNSSIKRLLEFQFGGETASHGVPIR